MDFKDYLKLFDEKNKSLVPETTYPEIESTGQDNTDRQKLVDDAVKSRRWSLIPQAIAGAGDTLSAANAAYGGPGTTGAQANVNKEVSNNIANTSAQFEKGLGDNPSSDESKQYQNLLGRFLGKDPTQFAQMSASQIKDQIPAIEKLAGMETQKSLKELGLATLASSRDNAQADRALREKELGAKITATQKEKSDKDAANWGAQFNSDKDVVAIKGAKRAAEDNDKVIDQSLTNPMANNSLPILMARSFAGTSRINQQELKILGGSKAVTDRLGQIAKEMTQGTLTQNNYNYMKDLNNVMKNSYDRNLNDSAMQYTKRMTKIHGGDLASNYSLITGNDTMPTDDSNPSISSPSSTTLPQVGGTYNGGKVLKVTRIK